MILVEVHPWEYTEEEFRKLMEGLFEFGRENKQMNDTIFALEDGACPT